MNFLMVFMGNIEKLLLFYGFAKPAEKIISTHRKLRISLEKKNNYNRVHRSQTPKSHIMNHVMLPCGNAAR